MEKPAISVLLTVYNAEQYLRAAIDSVLDQTFSNFELIIIDDGSSDASRRIIQSYSDARIVPILNNRNQGFIAVLNQGLKHARSDLVARMDADDISSPSRFQQQITYLLSHPTVTIVGSDVEVIDGQDNHIGYEALLTDPEALRRALPVMCPFAHGAVMFHKEAIQKVGGYRDTDFLVEDYELWARLLQHYDGANIPQPLYKWRVNKHGMSQSSIEKRAAGAKLLTDTLWDEYGVEGPAPKKMWYIIWSSTNNTLPKIRRRRMAELHILFGRRYLERGQRSIAIQHSSAAIVMYPNFLPFYGYLILSFLPYSVLRFVEQGGVAIRRRYRGW